MKYCTSCGKELLENSSFCVNCGNKVELNSQPKKKLCGFSISSMVIGISVHVYQFFFYFSVVFIIDSITFLSSLLSGKRSTWTLYDRFQVATYLMRYSFPIVIILSITGLVFGYIGIKKGNKKMAKAGIILSIVELVLVILELVFIYPWR